MAELLQRFSGNPFTTPVGQKIEQATDPSLTSENWALNMEICDIINETDDGARDAVRAIKKRLQQSAGKNFTVFMYALTVLETCVKNCGKRFHVLVTNKDFVQDLFKLIGPKNDPPLAVQEKVLSLIQSWAEAFHGQAEQQGVSIVYNDLRNKGIEFPKSSNDVKVPIYTPQRSMVNTEIAASPPNTSRTPPSVSQSMSQSNREASEIFPIHLSPEQLNKLKSDLDIVQKNINVLREMLAELKPGQEHKDDWDLLVELNSTCQQMQKRIVKLIEKVANEEVTSELLRINDEMNNLFLRFERFKKQRDQRNEVDQNYISIIASTSSANIKPSPSENINNNSTNITSLIDFTDDEPDITNGLNELNISQTSHQTNKAQPPTENFGDQEFDMFAQLRSSSIPASSPQSQDLLSFDPVAEGSSKNIDTTIPNHELPKPGVINKPEGLPSTDINFDQFLNRMENESNKKSAYKPDTSLI